MELTPSDVGFQDRYVVQEIIKEMAKNRPIDTKGKKGYKGDPSFEFLSFTKLEILLSIRIQCLEALQSAVI